MFYAPKPPNVSKKDYNRLIEMLPHGSGINGTWKITRTKNYIVAANYYEAMNETGFYCHTYNFTAYFNQALELIDLDIEEETQRQAEEDQCYCNEGLEDYLYQTIDTQIYITQEMK